MDLSKITQPIIDFWNAGTWQKVVLIVAPILLISMLVPSIRRKFVYKIPLLGGVAKALPNVVKEKRKRVKKRVKSARAKWQQIRRNRKFKRSRRY